VIGLRDSGDVGLQQRLGVGQERGQHTVEDKELEDYFKNLWLDEEAGGGGGG
jgi:hypothetical protein